MYRYRRRHLKEDTENLDRWLVSYADYMTLMFALFVVLYAISVVKEESFRTLSESFSAMFSVRSESLQIEPFHADGLLEQQSNYMQYGEGVLDTQGSKLVDEESQLVNIDQQKQGTPLNGIHNKLTDVLSPLIDAGLAEVSENEEWLVLNLSSSLLFSSGSAYPSSNLNALIKVISNSLRESDNYIRIRGYTDSSPIANEQFSSNWLLSATRANAVLEAMHDEGIAGQRLAVEAYGDNFAVADNSSPEGRAKNRRVAIAISKWAALDDTALLSKLREQQTATLPEQNETIDNMSDKVEVDQGEPFDASGIIRVINLPGGGIRITTLDESEVIEEGSQE